MLRLFRRKVSTEETGTLSPTPTSSSQTTSNLPPPPPPLPGGSNSSASSSKVRAAVQAFEAGYQSVSGSGRSTADKGKRSESATPIQQNGHGGSGSGGGDIDPNDHQDGGRRDDKDRGGADSDANRTAKPKSKAVNGKQNLTIPEMGDGDGEKTIVVGKGKGKGRDGSGGTSRDVRQVAFASPPPSTGARSPSPGPAPISQQHSPPYRSPSALSGPAASSHSTAISPVPNNPFPFPSTSPNLSTSLGVAMGGMGTAFGSQLGHGDRDPTQIYSPVTWTEMTGVGHGDLVDNVSGRERTRQEVLWELVASEERYVSELISLRDHYVEPLLHPLRHSSSHNTISASPPFHSPSPTSFRDGTSPEPSHRAQSPTSILAAISMDRLPIAAKFLRRNSVESGNASGSIVDGVMTAGDTHLTVPEPGTEESEGSSQGQDQNHRSTPKANGAADATLGRDPRHHASLPALPRTTIDTGGRRDSNAAIQPPQNPSASTASLAHRPQPGSQRSTSSTRKGSPTTSPTRGGGGGGGLTTKFRHHLRPPPSSKKLHKSKTSVPSEVTAPPQLSESFRKILETVGEGLLKGHGELCVRLKERYAEQWPLVRSLADVWADQEWILNEYGQYVLHLEKTLAEIDEALSSVSKGKGSAEDKRLGKTIIRLEEKASLDGESGLAICLSKPFQRLLKYPLLFQNLLYHTDPSTHEYESSRSMAIEIDNLVRSIEDEKVSEEEREQVRDVFARIEGINNKALMAPRSSRCLFEEVSVWQPPTLKRSMSDAPRPTNLTADDLKVLRENVLRQQKPSRRLSDLAPSPNAKPPSMGSKKDIWLVVFSDVVIRCQRIGVTILSGSALSKSKSSKSAKKKAASGKQRNLYKFLQVESWEMREPLVSDGGRQRPGMVSMDDIARTRGPGISALNPDNEEALTETSDEEDEEHVSTGATSRMSFSYANDDPKPIQSNHHPVKLPKSSTGPTGASGATTTTTTRSAAGGATSPRSASNTMQQVVAKNTPAAAKFGTRLRPMSVESPIPSSSSPAQRASRSRQQYHHSHTQPHQQDHHRSYNAPTASSLAKRGTSPHPPPGATTTKRSESAQPTVGRRGGSGSDQGPGSGPQPSSSMPPPSAMAGTGAATRSAKSSRGGAGAPSDEGRDDSGVFLYQAYWKGGKMDPNSKGGQSSSTGTGTTTPPVRSTRA